MIQSTDLDMLFLHQVVVQMQDLQVMDLFYKNLTPQLVQQILRVQTYFGSGTLNHENEQRNFRFIAHAHWASNVANVLTELPHDLSVDSRVELINIKSGVNTTGAGNSGFNGTFHVTGITSAREFTVGIATDPGSFTSDTQTRTTSLPHFKRKNFETTYFIQDIEELQQYKQGEQDGIYYLNTIKCN